MKILKIYNNNVVSCSDKGKEMILTGAGIGFQKKPGDTLDKEKVTQKFYLEDGQKEKIYKILDRIPTEYFNMTNYILNKACQKFNLKLNLHVLVPFIDHLTTAIERTKKNTPLPNIYLMETKAIWPEEFEFSLWIMDYIEEQIGVRLPLDEAGYFTVHLVSDDNDTRVAKRMRLLDTVTDIIKIIEDCYHIQLKKDSLSYMRLVTHLRFFSGRIVSLETNEGPVNEDIYRLLIHDNSKLVNCGKAITKYIYDEYQYNVSQAELMYLMIHITQILDK